jgi:hypothetical protein
VTIRLHGSRKHVLFVFNYVLKQCN